MAVYPGNSALSTAVKDRVISTFQQTVTLYKQGRTEEVVQGCGLILRMDPLFDPAKKLMEKARNPSSPINVDALIATDPIADARSAMVARNFQKVVDITTETGMLDVKIGPQRGAIDTGRRFDREHALGGNARPIGDRRL